jgi:hypothetical protein
MSGGAGYAQRHLEHSDYYDEHRRVQGEWHGRGSELLGLRGEVTREQFEAVRDGLHPETDSGRATGFAETIGFWAQIHQGFRLNFDFTLEKPVTSLRLEPSL